ncbi:MAG: neutral/alkaline non-lysosomal ceramidase N-terminal domain-containing protein [Agitococcus sp.]|nr:neutral/alkaline non-lysosomal ceramidase N-terminal domain-containing protein [Agitococcus sp.]
MYIAGWSKQEILVKAQGYAMMGYGMWHNRARGHDTPLYARAFYLQDSQDHALIFCCLDLGYITYAMRSAVVEILTQRLGQSFDESSLVLTCTHTHSGPGGCSHDALYNVVTPGFVSDNLQQIVNASVEAILAAQQSAAPTELKLASGRFANDVPVAWNRSLHAYNQNPDVVPQDKNNAHLALDRTMPILSFYRDDELQSLLSFFGVHATCIGNTQEKYSGDNKGYASLAIEKELAKTGVNEPVAIFAQATAGDVSPHYHGAGDSTRRRNIKGAAEYVYAQRNGQFQAEQAMAIVQQAAEEKLSGRIDSILNYVDFSHQKANPQFANGDDEAFTSEPCHGVAFFAGTPIDGPGMPSALAMAARKIAQGVKKFRLKNLHKYSTAEQDYYRRLYAAQGAKDILLEDGTKRILGQAIDKLMIPAFADPLVGELKRQAAIGAINQSALVPTVLPLQIIIIGQLAIVCCAGEFTTVAGQRVVQTVAEALKPRGIKRVLICTYCNDYMGYVTTREEYQQQAYEGGHTIFGQWTLAAFQTRFAYLAEEFCKPLAERTYDKNTRPQPTPQDELALRSNLAVPK